MVVRFVVVSFVAVAIVVVVLVTLLIEHTSAAFTVCSHRNYFGAAVAALETGHYYGQYDYPEYVHNAQCSGVSAKMR